MPTSADPSNIRAFVHWNKPTIYAGEEIECIITFKNIAEADNSTNGGNILQNKELGTNASTIRSKGSQTINGSLREARRASYAQSALAAAMTGPSRRTLSTASKPGLARGLSGGRTSASQTQQQQSFSQPPVKGHRPTLSLNVVSASSRPVPQSTAIHQSIAADGISGLGNKSGEPDRPGRSHGRSLSIISLSGKNSPVETRSPVPSVTAESPRSGRRPSAHARSASLQHMPRSSQPNSALAGFPSPRQPSPLYEAITPPAQPESPLATRMPAQQQQLPVRPNRRNPSTVSAGSVPQSARRPSPRHHGSSDSFSDVGGFKFPAVDSPSNASSAIASPVVELPKPVRTPSNMHSSQTRHFSPRALPPPDSAAWQNTGSMSNLNPLTRVMSTSSTDGTPRSSSEMYTMSNNSDETLTSEAPSHLQVGLGRHGALYKGSQHNRQASRSPQTRPPEQETLMMAYVQTQGHFTLDGGLVNAAPFEEVKRKGVQGGGGVVGVERFKRSSGLFGGFGWGALGDLLGGDEMSSLAQMKASAGSKDIPLLSTPQSLLFVDLKLAPGESRSYSYRFNLPRGLPPSYRGRGIKISYHLTLGVQRPEGQATGLTRQVDVPFRVLGSYDARGDSLMHDLMQPYVLLQDSARTQALSSEQTPNSAEAWLRLTNTIDAANLKKKSAQGFEDFLRYSERLLDMSSDAVDQPAGDALLSPTSPYVHTLPSPSVSRQGSLVDQGPNTAREAIDLAIMRANMVRQRSSSATARGLSSGSATNGSSTNRFNIARAGQPIAVLTLLRPAFRLGEAVVGTIDFSLLPAQPDTLSPPPATTYSLLIELESCEEISPALALRSAASIQRVTRKVHASARENALFARRIAFDLTVPAIAAPTFATTGISLIWRLRVEFTTQRPPAQGLGIRERDGGMINNTSPEETLLEVLGSDERGTTLLAKEHLLADVFEVAVPLQIFGAIGIDAESAETDALEI